MKDDRPRRPAVFAGLRAFLADALRWNRAGVPPAFQVVAATLGLAGPIALGAAAGHLALGAAASIGGLALSMGGEGATGPERALAMGRIAVVGALAMLAGGAIARLGPAAGFLVPAVAGAAGLIGGFSRPLAAATTRFILFTVIAVGAGDAGANPLPMAAVFLLGAVWTALLSLGLRPLFALRRGGTEPPARASAVPRRPTLGAQIRRWWRSLAHWPAWQYPARITACLVVAEALAWLLPAHHAYWVALTVAIVVRRRTSESLMRAFERGLGTVCGVGLAMLLFLWSPPPAAVIAMVAALAALRTVLRGANYTAYATIMTPLVMLLLDLGQPPSLAIMLDRLWATIVGCVLGLTLGYLIWPKVQAATPAAGRGRTAPSTTESDM